MGQLRPDRIFFFWTQNGALFTPDVFIPPLPQAPRVQTGRNCTSTLPLVNPCATGQKAKTTTQKTHESPVWTEEQATLGADSFKRLKV